jgi:hypothetical protein
VCPACASHAKIHETHCPNCGARLKKGDGWVGAPAAAVVAMGLTAVTCGDDVETKDDGPTVSQSSSSISAAYTVSQTVGGGFGGFGGAAGESGGGQAGEGGAGGAGGAGGQ